MSIKNIMIHHTAVSYTKNPDQFKATNEYHKAQWNFKSSLGYYVGYNYEISSRGKVYKAREDGEKTAACYQGDMNNGETIHIVLDGNFDIEKPKPAQIFALRDLLIDIANKYKITKERIFAHNQYAPKTCPGQNFDMQFIRNLIPGIIPPNTIKEQILKSLNELSELIKKANIS